MAVTVEKSGKTVQEAIDSALEELKASVEDVIIEVLEEGENGVLGIGRKPALVRVTFEAGEETPVGAPPEEDLSEAAFDAQESEDDAEYYGDDEDYEGDPESPEETEAVNFLSGVLSGIGIRGQISSYKEDDTLHIDVTGDDVGAVIGRRGETLNALQYLVTLVACRNSEERVRVYLDIGGYRHRRDMSLASLAERTAAKVVDTDQPVALEPMNPAERRIIHTSLQDFTGVTTHSEGEGAERRVIVSPVQEQEE